MKTYIIKEKTEVDKGLKKSLGWGVWDGKGYRNDTVYKDRLEAVDRLHLLFSLGWCSVTEEQKWEFKELGYDQSQEEEM